jgi:hypothetical protein
MTFDVVRCHSLSFAGKDAFGTGFAKTSQYEVFMPTL